MAELAHVFVEQTTEQTTTNTSYEDITGAAITSGNFTAGKKYLIIVSAQTRANGANAFYGVQTLHGSTPFAESEMVYESDSSTIRVPYFWFTVWEAVSSEGIKLQFKTETGTAGADQIVMAAIKLSDDLTENTDWHFNASGTSQGLSTTYSSSNNASITFTPGTANDDWLVMAYARVDTDSATTSHQSRINRNDTDLTPVEVHEGEDVTNEFHLMKMLRVYTLAASSQTFTQQSATSSGTAHTRTHSGIFALNLNKLRNHTFAYGVGIVSTDTTNDFSTSTQLQTTSITPDITGDVFCLVSTVEDAGATGAIQKIRMQVDNSDQPGTQTTDNYTQIASHDTRDQHTWAIFSVGNLSNAAHTIDMDATASSVRDNIDRLALAFSMELPAAGGAATHPGWYQSRGGWF